MRRGYQLALGVAIFAAVWLQAVHIRLVQEEMAAGGMLPMPAKRGSFYVVHRDCHVAGVVCGDDLGATAVAAAVAREEACWAWLDVNAEGIRSEPLRMPS